jgi:hypothetical protein
VSPTGTTGGDPITALQAYRQNLTYPKNKIPGNLLVLIDPGIQNWDNNTGTKKRVHDSSRHLIPAEQQLQNLISRPVGIGRSGVFDHLCLSQLVNVCCRSIVTKSMNRMRSCMVLMPGSISITWNLAALNELKEMELVQFAEHSEEIGNNSPQM